MNKVVAILEWSLLLISLAIFSSAQTIHVDTTPENSTNHFRPIETLGAGVDRIPSEAIDHDLIQPNLDRALASGWQPVTYRQNTDLAVEAWHWNPQGTWSEPGEKGYFVGSATPTENLRYSYGYPLPRRGFTRNGGVESGFSRLTDGDENTFWKSNPYLAERFTSESDALHPQWVILDLSQTYAVDSIRIAWAEPYATQFVVQHWVGADPVSDPTRGIWQAFPMGTVDHGQGGSAVLLLAPSPIPVRFVRILMTASSNTCGAQKSSDPRDCVGYAIRELYLGTRSADGLFHDILRHVPDQEQTTTYCSSVDPWHAATDLGTTKQAQVGFDIFFNSGVTRGLPAMIPVAMLYETPENAVAEIAYIENRKYPISYVEMGEEADGQYTSPEDYGALYIQWATALRRLDPKLKLGGPSFEGVNQDILYWPDAEGNVSWTSRFIQYLKSHNRLKDLAFFSFEHYPYDPCKIPWSSLYDEPQLVSHIMQVWHDDGVPKEIPFFITEGNLSSSASETYMDIFSGLWLADYIGSFLNAGGNGVYLFHYLPLPMEHGCNNSPGTFGLMTVDRQYNIQQPLAQFFISQLINLEWVVPGKQEHDVFPAASDISDGGGHDLVTAYGLKRPDGQWSLLLVNRDQSNAYHVKIAFDRHGSERSSSFDGPVEIATFGKNQYHWHPGYTRSAGHAEYPSQPSVVAETSGNADPDGPILHTKQNADATTSYELPAASVVVIHGNIRER
ncbi:MAG: discoidin domain-containing protein [Terriglobales bacterium]|jgi:phage-related protein